MSSPILLEKIIRGEVSLESLTEDELEEALVSCDRLIVILEATAYKKGFTDLVSPDSVEQIQEGEKLVRLAQSDPSTLTDEEREMVKKVEEVMVNMFGVPADQVETVMKNAAERSEIKEAVADFDEDIEAAKARGAFIINPDNRNLN